MWLSLVNRVLKLVNSFTDYLMRKQLINLGKGEAIKDGLERVLKSARRAKDVKEAIDRGGDDVDRVRDELADRRKSVLHDTRSGPD